MSNGNKTNQHHITHFFAKKNETGERPLKRVSFPLKSLRPMPQLDHELENKRNRFDNADIGIETNKKQVNEMWPVIKTCQDGS